MSLLMMAGLETLRDYLTAVDIPEAACAEAIAQGVHSADVVLNILARQRWLSRS